MGRLSLFSLSRWKPHRPGIQITKIIDRYFPHLVKALIAAPGSKLLLDGEIVIPLNSNLSLDDLLMRIHPGGRFRHGAKFLRWRHDKNPRECTLQQVQRENRSALALL